MRRRPRALSVAVVTGAALLGAASAVSAEPAAEISPASVRPGGSITVAVSCDPVGGPAPKTMDATSQAFDEGTVALHLVSGNDDEVSGPAYRGTARIAPAGEFESGQNAVGRDSAWTVDGTCPAARGGKGKPWSATFTVTHTDGGGGGGGNTPKPCHTAWDATSCPPATVEHGVRAGTGGTFTDSVPALVGGGLLIAGAFGGAVYRLRRKSPRAQA
ncbi:hypothetical protein ACIQAC_07940 [Streptomyces sp. NPDC088387]|uniref:hypothetical protein n=1 Tax=Streptomyces sp. NPDC088387 TaxID=3365859 RepID=UPI0037F1B624